MVRCRYLTPEHLIRAMKAGDFYASSGVTLADLQLDRQHATIKIDIEPVAGETYRTDFIATLAPQSEIKPSADQPVSLGGIKPEAVGIVIATSEGLHAEYRLTGKELYVRAIITSSAGPDDPSYEGQKKQAWTQPVMP